MLLIGIPTSGERFATRVSGDQSSRGIFRIGFRSLIGTPLQMSRFQPQRPPIAERSVTWLPTFPAISSCVHFAERGEVRHARLADVQLEQIDPAQGGKVGQPPAFRKVQPREGNPGERREVEDLRVAEVEREPAVLADGQALFERALGGDGRSLSREPVIDEELLLLAEQPGHRHQFRGGALLLLHGEVEFREAFAGELAIVVPFRREQFVAELRR